MDKISNIIYFLSAAICAFVLLAFGWKWMLFTAAVFWMGVAMGAIENRPHKKEKNK